MSEQKKIEDCGFHQTNDLYTIYCNVLKRCKERKMFELYIYPLKLSKRGTSEKVPTIHVFACHAAQFLRVDLSSVGPDLVPAGIGVHRDVKTRGELLASPPSHEGSLHLLLDVPVMIGINISSSSSSSTSHLQMSLPMVPPCSLLSFLRLGSLRVRVVVNFLNWK